MTYKYPLHWTRSIVDSFLSPYMRARGYGIDGMEEFCNKREEMSKVIARGTAQAAKKWYYFKEACKNHANKLGITVKSI